MWSISCDSKAIMICIVKNLRGGFPQELRMVPTVVKFKVYKFLGLSLSSAPLERLQVSHCGWKMRRGRHLIRKCNEKFADPVKQTVVYCWELRESDGLPQPSLFLTREHSYKNISICVFAFPHSVMEKFLNAHVWFGFRLHFSALVYDDFGHL